MSRRTLRQQIAGYNAGLADCPEDPLAGVINLDVFLKSGDDRGRTFGPASSERMRVHRDGYSSAHSGACSIATAEDPVERLRRLAGLDHQEAEILRYIAAEIDRAAIAHAPALIGSDTIAVRFGLSLRTAQRRLAAIEQKLADVRASLRDLGG